MGRCTHSAHLLVPGRASPATVETVRSGSGIDSVSARGDPVLTSDRHGRFGPERAAQASGSLYPNRLLKRSEVRHGRDRSLSK